MKVKTLILATNPFLDAYIHSDFLGKIIFIALILLSICSWIILIHKVKVTWSAKKNSLQFTELLQGQRENPLNFAFEGNFENKPNPFLDLYNIFKKHTTSLLNKNQSSSNQPKTISYLSTADIECVASHLMSGVAHQTKHLEKNLFILATIVSLGPFLGLLGTVWGILTTFSEMQSQAGGSTSQMVLSGLSLALATTVLGLLDAIPALIGYNYLKSAIRDFEIDMEGFSTEIVALIEMQYRKVDV